MSEGPPGGPLPGAPVHRLQGDGSTDDRRPEAAPNGHGGPGFQGAPWICSSFTTASHSGAISQAPQSSVGPGGPAAHRDPEESVLRPPPEAWAPTAPASEGLPPSISSKTSSTISGSSLVPWGPWLGAEPTGGPPALEGLMVTRVTPAAKPQKPRRRRDVPRRAPTQGSPDRCATPRGLLRLGTTARTPKDSLSDYGPWSPETFPTNLTDRRREGGTLGESRGPPILPEPPKRDPRVRK